MSVPESFTRVDLGLLTQNLERCSADHAPSRVEGRRRLRDLLVAMYDCGEREAHRLLEHLEQGGYIRARRITERRRRGGDVARRRGRRTRTAEAKSNRIRLTFHTGAAGRDH